MGGAVVSCLDYPVICNACSEWFSWGLDFTGGTQVQVSYQQPADLNAIHEQLNQAGFEDAVIISFGTSKDVLISLVPKDNSELTQDVKAQAELVKKVMAALPGAKMEQVNYIGPQVGGEMASKGLIAVIFALCGTMIYIAIRFGWYFAIGSTVALLHDPILILGVFSFGILNLT